MVLAKGEGLRSAVCCGQAHLHDASCTWLIVVGRFLPYYTDCPRGSLPNFSTRERLGLSMRLDKSLLVCHKMFHVHPICDLWVFGEYSNEGFVDIYIFFWAKKVRTKIKGLKKAVRGEWATKLVRVYWSETGAVWLLSRREECFNRWKTTNF